MKLEYKYKGRVINVVDADTVDASVDVGFGITVTQRFRIDSYDAPETYRPKSKAEKEHGLEATARAYQLLVDKQLYFITSKEPGIYGRYGAQIILDDDRDYAQVMISEGYQKLDNYKSVTVKKRLKNKEKKIKSNKAKCKECGDVIESKHRHDFVTCSCGSVSVDGGKDYIRRLGKFNLIEELSEYE